MSEQKELWAIVELMGHVRLAGRLTEEEHFGAKMGRLDIPLQRKESCPNCTPESAKESPCPVCQAGSFVTQFFGGGSVYRITPVSEDVARHAAKSIQAAPVSSWDYPEELKEAARLAKATLPRPEEAVIGEDDFGDDGSDDDSDYDSDPGF